MFNGMAAVSPYNDYIKEEGYRPRRRRKKEICNSKVLKHILNCLEEEKHIHMLKWVSSDTFQVMYVHQKSSLWKPCFLSLFEDLDGITNKDSRKHLPNYAEKSKGRCKANLQKLVRGEILSEQVFKILKAVTLRQYKILQFPAGVKPQACNLIPFDDNENDENNDENAVFVSSNENIPVNEVVIHDNALRERERESCFQENILKNSEVKGITDGHSALEDVFKTLQIQTSNQYDALFKENAMGPDSSNISNATFLQPPYLINFNKMQMVAETFPDYVRSASDLPPFHGNGNGPLKSAQRNMSGGCVDLNLCGSLIYEEKMSSYVCNNQNSEEDTLMKSCESENFEKDLMYMFEDEKSDLLLGEKLRSSNDPYLPILGNEEFKNLNRGEERNFLCYDEEF